jgi:hypothetical protein
MVGTNPFPVEHMLRAGLDNVVDFTAYVCTSVIADDGVVPHNTLPCSFDRSAELVMRAGVDHHVVCSHNASAQRDF